MSYKIGRINERNIGNITLDGEPKKRRMSNKKPSLTEEEKAIAKAVIQKVLDCLEYDKQLSGVGHLNANAKYTDGGRFILSISRADMELLTDAKDKL